MTVSSDRHALDPHPGLIDAALERLPRSLLIWGPDQVQRRAVARALSSHASLVARFADRRRIWVDAASVRTRSELVVALAAAMQSSPTGFLEPAVLEDLRQQPTFLVLDGVDMALMADSVDVDEFAAELIDLPTLLLVVTSPSRERTFSIPWTRLEHIENRGVAETGDAQSTVPAGDSAPGSIRVAARRVTGRRARHVAAADTRWCRACAAW